MKTNVEKFKTVFSDNLRSYFEGIPDKTVKYLITVTVDELLNNPKSINLHIPTFRQTANTLSLENTLEAYKAYLEPDRKEIELDPAQIRLTEAKALLKKFEEIELRQAKALGSSKEYYDPEEVLDRQLEKMFKEMALVRETEKDKKP